MLDTSSRANFKPTAEIDDLDALAKAVRERAPAGERERGSKFLQHMLDAGDALIRAKAQVKHGKWLPWLKLCDLSADKAERYMKLARHRAELNSAGVRNLSLSAALRLFNALAAVKRPSPRTGTTSTTSKSGSRTKITDSVAPIGFAFIWKRT